MQTDIDVPEADVTEIDRNRRRRSHRTTPLTKTTKKKRRQNPDAD